MGNKQCTPNRTFIPPQEIVKYEKDNPGGEVEYLEARECWDFMCNGCKLIKILPKKKKKKEKKFKGKRKFIVLDEDLMGFRYKPSKKPKGYKVSINVIKDVLSGNNLPQNEVIPKYHRECQFTILYESNNILKTMHFVTFSMEAATKWAFGLQAMLKRKGLLLSKPDPLREEWLKDAFVKFDADHNGALSLNEVEKLLHSLNVDMDSKLLKMLFNEANIQGIQGHKNGTLTKEEFADFFKRLSTREEIIRLLEKFAEDGKGLTIAELAGFLTTKQQINDVTNAMCLEIIEKFEPVGESREKGYLGVDGLTNYLFSDECNILDPKCSTIYQDMNHPLSHYFISSSHNTYLLEDQLRGPSSVEGYISALKQGCRCLEIDCWDGEDNEPTIYHGHTFTSKILFRDAIAAIKKYAFCESAYPLILTLENHCSIDQQKVMARHLIEILGDSLCCDPVDENRTSLPTPESLKYKILIKGKKLSAEKEGDGDDLGDVSEEDEAAEMVIQDDDTTDGLKEMFAKRQEKQKEKEKSDRNNGLMRRVSRGRSFSLGSKFGKLKLARELSRLVNYLCAVKFHSFEQAHTKRKYYQMSSFSESKFLGLGESEGNAFVRYNTKFISRTYPGGIRVDSSNYNPQDAWNLGCHIVALNYQTDGQMMDFYRGKFMDNGNCGYLLKPSFMREANTTFDPNAEVPMKGLKSTLVKIQLISGRLLPKPKKAIDNGIVDPYVQIETSGLPCDTYEKIHSSKVIHNNGFNPVWDELIQFKVKVPQLVLLRFSVYDSDLGSDDFLAQFTAPLTSLRQGYRHVRLLSKQGIEIPNASLFVHISMEHA